MLDEVRLSHGVMEGKGAYNRHAKIPAGNSFFGEGSAEDSA
jgi:hypothetical protein